MAQMWIQDPTGTWVPATTMIKNAAGWTYVNYIYQKTGTSTWTLRYSRNTTPPGAPTLAITAATNGFNIRVTAPSTPSLALVRVKVGTTGYPTSYANNDSNYFPGWSDLVMAPSTSTTITFPPSGSSTVTGRPYYVSAWAQDTSFNWSTVATATYTIPAPVVVVPVHKSGYFTTVDSASYSGAGNYWRSDNNYVYQGGTNIWRGCWFYSNKLHAALARAKQITKMQVFVQRVNTQHGVTGAANVRMIAHSWASQPGGDPFTTFKYTTTVGALNRGQGAWINIPSLWWPYFISGGFKGVGLYAGSTSYTDPNYMYAYGAGTNSGKIYIEWTE